MGLVVLARKGKDNPPRAGLFEASDGQGLEGPGQGVGAHRWLHSHTVSPSEKQNARNTRLSGISGLLLREGVGQLHET